jgi:SAM-dependent methyltransferase
MNIEPHRQTSLLSRLRKKLGAARRGSRSPRPVGDYERECPICGYHGLFHSYGNPRRRDALCPKCGSLERHRLLKLWFERNVDSLRGGRALHFAPEECIKAILGPVAGKYLTADIVDGRADKTLNIESMSGEPDASYDWVICSHVLEHVDDRKALAELRRILKPNGIVIIMIPIVEGWANTHEDAAVRTAEGRKLFFGQGNHVRYYGADVRDRIAAAGFTLEEFTAVEPQVSQFGLVRGEKVFVAKRQS